MNIDALKISRTPIRRAVSNLIKNFEIEIEKGDNMSIEVIEETLAKLVDKESTLVKLDHAIQNLCKIDNLEKEIEESERYKDQIITWKVRANRILNKISSISTVNKNSVQDNDRDIKIIQSTVRLPLLEIGKYDGNILNFAEFWEQFKMAIHENETINKVQRFIYLKSYLINDAATAIQGLTLTPENYDIAIDILHERFGRKEMIIDAYVNKLLNLTPVRKSFDTQSLRTLYSECEINIRGLKNLGIEINSHNCLLYPILIKLIPKDLTLEFSKQRYKKENSISELLEFLKIEIECRERNEYLHNERSYETQEKKNIPTVENKGNMKTEQSRKSLPLKVSQNMPVASAFNTLVSKEKCVFCDSDLHEKELCKLTIKEKRNALMKNGRFFGCFGRNHLMSKCYKTKFCKGNKTHHPLICDCSETKYFDSETKGKNPCSFSPTAIETTQNFLSATGAYADERSAKVYCATSKELGVYLQTLKAEIMNENKTSQIRVLCDLGANKSFCTKKCAQEMNLKVISDERMKIFSFGKTSENIENKNKVQIKLRNPLDHKQEFFMDAIVTDIITNAEIPPPCDKIKSLCEKSSICLVDEIKDENKEISLLIGSDFLWKFYTGKVQRLSENLVAMETIFGYCLSGRQNLDSKSAFILNVMTEQIPRLDHLLSGEMNKNCELEYLKVKDNIENSENNIDVLENFEMPTKFKNHDQEKFKKFEKTLKNSERNKNIVDKQLFDEIKENYFFQKIKIQEKEKTTTEKF